MTQSMKIPGPDHPIEIRPAKAHVVVRAAGRVVADTDAALVLQEASYPPVYYIPRKDADMSQLVHSTHVTHCPYKGECSYYSIAGEDERGRNAVWSYESPYPAVAAIAGHLAFYPDRVDGIETVPAP
ncbi:MULTISPECIES: DUF427 domain-containing protein [unclassified Achromobacter]|uniref:DUF427 domain-containing protein n=1 Tax=unclassified Achromobacter TaxID=2626865 RepID=UPI000B5190B2|nr:MULTISPECIES: DUF427 domain-containing protein [unclassified Achromobacter]OWT75007.1 hypothetical protein CEY04_20825 [Achromobacter sp. HZ28]OWT76616.1 hypothetical protein CEY05_16280 [Achromobacter sp. HZ34]